MSEYQPPEGESLAERLERTRQQRLKTAESQRTHITNEPEGSESAKESSRKLLIDLVALTGGVLAVVVTLNRPELFPITAGGITLMIEGALTGTHHALQWGSRHKAEKSSISKKRRTAEVRAIQNQTLRK